MITAWIKNLKTEADKQAFYKQFRNSSDILERLQEIVKEDMSSMEVSEMSLADYDSPNWSYKQAHRNGQKSYASKILKLINLDQGTNIQ
jgi:hypothetical protein